MTLALHGIGVSKGVAIGKVHLIERIEVEITEYCLTEQSVEEEIERLKVALEIARTQLRQIRDHLPESTLSEINIFIDTHLLMLEDSLLTEVPFQLIRQQRCNAEWALKQQCDKLVKIFDEMEDPYLSTRKNDVEHVVARVQRILRGHTELPNERIEAHLENTIVVADDLSPADTMLMQHHGILAFITDYGGAMSHTAILARSLGIPAIVGVRHGRFFLKQGDTLIVDGFHGVVLADPEESSLHYYRQCQREEKRHQIALNKTKGAPAVTLDGTPITLQTNIEFPEDVAAVKRVGGGGVGLYRTEFLFMNRPAPPEEEEHLDAYLHVIRALKGGTVIIRTLDIGSDKTATSLNRYTEKLPPACNPALGLRAIRLCLRDKQLFKPQLRAILRASAQGKVWMMIPMISSVQEILQVRNMLQDIHREFEQKSIKFNRNMPLGIMVEVPAMALCMDLFADQVDFLSIGTNDLTQYTLAIDRADDSVSHLYDPLHPSILRLIKMTLDAANKSNKPVSMCGEMASDSRYIRLLLGLGLRTFSVNPGAFLEVKQIINNSDLRRLTRLANKTLKTGIPADISNLLDAINSN